MTVASHRVGIGRRFRAPAAPAPEQAPARRSPLRFALSAAGPERSNDEIMAELANVAEEHAPEGGYGETAWNAGSGTVFWVCADWTSDEEHDAAEAAFRAVEGVENFEHEAEAALPEGDGWERVWPAAATASAADPIVVDLPPARVHAGPSPGALLASAGRALAEAAEALSLEQQVAAPQQLHVHVAQPAIHLEMAAPAAPAPAAPAIVVNVPEQPAPEVNVTVEAPVAPPPPPVNVTVEAAPVPNVDVHVAPTPVTVAAAPAPDVTVNVEVPRPGPIRVETEDDGTRVYIPEEA